MRPAVSPANSTRATFRRPRPNCPANEKPPPPLQRPQTAAESPGHSPSCHPEIAQRFQRPTATPHLQTRDGARSVQQAHRSRSAWQLEHVDPEGCSMVLNRRVARERRTTISRHAAPDLERVDGGDLVSAAALGGARRHVTRRCAHPHLRREGNM